MKNALGIFHNIYSSPVPARTMNDLHHENMVVFWKAKPWKVSTSPRLYLYFQDFLTLTLVYTQTLSILHNYQLFLPVYGLVASAPHKQIMAVSFRMCLSADFMVMFYPENSVL